MSFSPIACESCRTKKRKCDRKIPSCSQCIHSSLACTYPGTSKRGLPSGYIAKIEERLAQTEAALLQALSTIHASGACATENIGISLETAERQQVEFNEIRIAKVEEWQTYPLESERQQKEWMRHKISTGDLQGGVGVTAQQNGEPEPLDGESHQQAVSTRKRQRTIVPGQQQPDTTTSLTASERSRAAASNDDWTAGTILQTPYNTHLETIALDTRTQQPDTQSPAPLDPTPITQEPQLSDQPPSKAKRLSTLHSRKYF